MISFMRQAALIIAPLVFLFLLSGCDSNNPDVTNPVTPTLGPTVTPAPISNPTTPSTTAPKPTVIVPTPTPTRTPSPTPRPVTAKPQELVIRLDQFPLPGFKVADDLSMDEGQVWRRRFTADDAGSIGYNWLMIDVRSLSCPPSSSCSSIKPVYLIGMPGWFQDVALIHQPRMLTQALPSRRWIL